MWLTLIDSPVSGSGIRQSSGKACWRSNTAASICAPPARRGSAVTSSIHSPFMNSWRGVFCNPAKYSAPVRAPTLSPQTSERSLEGSERSRMRVGDHASHAQATGVGHHLLRARYLKGHPSEREVRNALAHSDPARSRPGCRGVHGHTPCRQPWCLDRIRGPGSGRRCRPHLERERRRGRHRRLPRSARQPPPRIAHVRDDAHRCPRCAQRHRPTFPSVRVQHACRTTHLPGRCGRGCGTKGADNAHQPAAVRAHAGHVPR